MPCQLLGVFAVSVQVVEADVLLVDRFPGGVGEHRAAWRIEALSDIDGRRCGPGEGVELEVGRHPRLCGADRVLPGELGLRTGPLSGRARPAAELDGSSKKTTAQKTILPVGWGKNDGNANLRFVVHTAEPVFIPG